MTSEAIAISVIAAIAAGASQAVAHHYAESKRWPAIPRYVCGLSIIFIAVGAVLFASLSLELAAMLYGLMWLIAGASGLATWLSYEADRARPHLMSEHDLDRMADEIAGKHREP